MSRSDQPIGITSEARNWLKNNEIRGEVCPTCWHPHPVSLEKIGTYSGYNEYSLYRHKLTNGHYADEFLQCTPWSSGPVFFLGLRVSDGTEFTWTEDEIEKAL